MRLSYSSEQLINSCARKFQLLKVLETGEYLSGDGSDRETSHTMFGHAVGAGVATLLLTGGNIERAIADCFLAWDFRYEGSPKYLQVAFACLFELQAQFPFEDYEPLTLPNGKPAAEAGIRLWLDEEGNKDYYVLFIDAVMLHKQTRRPIIIEVKTTKMAGEVAPMYTNSPQSILYSLPLPFLFPEYDSAHWDTIYIVFQIPNVWKPVVHLIPIEHTYTERLGVLMSVMLRYEQIQRMIQVNHFPKSYTGSCIAYGQLCPFYGVCDHLAMTCPPIPLEEQNSMDAVREGQVVLDLHLQELLAKELEVRST